MCSDEICRNDCAAATDPLEAVNYDAGIWRRFESFGDPADRYFEVGEYLFERHVEDRELKMARRVPWWKVNFARHDREDMGDFELA